MTLAPVHVRASRLEEFGFRVAGLFAFPGTSYVLVSEVFPNTAAAKAGLRPGELISKVDGKTKSTISLLGLLKTQDRKWAELEAGKKSVTWSLEVRAPGAAETRTVTMVVPSPAPHWGSTIWMAPEGRAPAVVKEAGPLAKRAREVMDNGIWTALQWGREKFFGAPPPNVTPMLGYEWRIVQPSGTHRIWVTQQRGKTEILLDHQSPATGASHFLTSPSGALEKTWCRLPKKNGKREEVAPEELRARFEAEINFWLTKVGRATGRWPFEALSGKSEEITISDKPSGETGASPSALFLKLPVADAAQKALFSDALGKIGLDEASWAYTETSHGFGDELVTTVRIDPSKPPAECSTLLKVNGKAPKAAHLKRWRDEARGAPAALGELPPISSIVDINDVRIFADETAAVVFELSVKTLDSGLPADKFQALFRVNKTLRGFEDFSVKLRESLRVAGIAKVTDAGMEVRFQTLDPDLAPQPVMLRAGGGARVFLVKLSRSFEATRTDFKRVVPFDEAENAIRGPASP